MNRFGLQGRRALVTGGSRGMGFAIAQAFAEAGADIVLAARDASALDAAARQLQPTGRQVGVEVFDLAQVENIAPRFAAMLERHGPIDILVNAAATVGRGKVTEMPVADFEAVLRLDLAAIFALSQVFARACMQRSAAGRIINIASVASFSAVRTPSVAYASAKGGLLLLTKQMAFELAPHGILVNAIAPGYIATELSKPFRETPEYETWREARVPMRRWGEPDEVAGPAVLLASAAGSFMTGSVLTVDGGLTCVL